MPATKYGWDSSNTPKMDSTWNSSHSLGEKIETMFTRFVQRVFLWVIDFLSDRLVDIFDNSMKIMSPGTERASKEIFNYMKSIPDMPDWFRKVMDSAETEKGESGFILRAAVFFVGVRSMIFGGLEPLQRWASYNADKSLHSFLPDPSSLAFMRRIGQMSEEGFIDAMQKLGLHEKLIPVYQELSKQLPAMGEVMAGKWRGVISEQDFESALHRMGYDDKAIALYKELSNNLPNIQDLIRMLVRDSFNDGAASTYGYDEDFPEEINQFFAKQGYNPDWAKRYWRAHWNLPSPNQAYEMLHRGLISTGDLETLLRISDYPKFWRDKLRDISFNLYTRVDVRRLLQAGMLNAEEAFKAYKEMGYDEQKARKLTDFAVHGISQDERDLTKSDVLNLYEEGLIDQGTARDNLVKMGYDSEEADSIIKLSDVNIAKAMRTDLINYTKEKYIASKIDDNTARSELSQIGLKQQSVDRYIMNWQRATEVQSAIPSIADVKRWFINDLIDEIQFRGYLKQLRHTDANIELYVKEITKAKADKNEQPA